MKKRIALTMASLLTFSSVACFAATKAPAKPAPKPTTVATKPVYVDTSTKIPAYFYNIKISIDGQTLNSPLEPFIYKDNVFVPLRTIVEGMGGTPNYDGNTKTISIVNNTGAELQKLKNNTSATDFQLNNLQAQVKTKDDKIKDLEKQISDLEKKVKDLRDDRSSSSSSTSDLRRDLEDRKYRYDDSTSGRMNFTYEVDKSSSRIDVTMKGDFSKSENVWKNRRTSDFKDFLKGVCTRINDNRDFRDYDIKIIVKDKNSDSLIRYDYTYRNSNYDYSEY